MTEQTGEKSASHITLWASAFVIAALVIVQAGRMRGNHAVADVVSRVSDYTVLTVDTGSEDVLLVLDGRGEELLAYQVESQKSLQFLGRENVRDLFLAGKRIGPGGVK